MSKKANHARHVTPKVNSDPGIFSTIRLARLVLSSVIFAVSLVAPIPDLVSTVLLALAAVVAGYEIIIESVNAVEARDFFATPLVVTVITVLAYVIGFGIEGASLVILYQIGLILIGYVEERTKRNALDLLKYQDEDTVDKVKENLAAAGSCKIELENTMRFCAGRVLKFAMLFALVYAVVIPLVTSYSYTVSIHRALTMILISTPVSMVVSIPLAAYVAMCYSAQEGVVFKNAAAMERADFANVAVFDKTGVFSSGDARVIAVKSDVLENDTFMDFVSHAVYYSEQPFAQAITALDEKEYKLEVISDFEEIPGYGVQLKIGGADVAFATSEYFSSRGEHIPANSVSEGISYHLMVSGRYIGYIVISSDVSTENAALTNELAACGIGRSILFTEDSNVSSQHIAEELNFKEVYGELNAEKKFQLVNNLSETSKNRLLYVYAEGSELHSAASVEMRVGTKSRIADAVVNPDNIGNIPFALQVCRRMKEVATVNAVFAFVVKAGLIFLSIIGYCNIWFAIFIDIVAALATLLATIRVTQNSFINNYRYKIGKR